LHDLGRLTGNYCSGAFVAPGQVSALEAHLKKAARDPAFRKRRGDPEPLAQALKYAKQHGLGVLEATEIVDAGGTLSWPDNLRADHKRNPKKTNNTASGCLKRAGGKALIAAVRDHWQDIEQGRFDVAIEPGWRLEPDMLALLARHCTSARLVLSESTETPPELLVHMALGERIRLHHPSDPVLGAVDAVLDSGDRTRADDVAGAIRQHGPEPREHVQGGPQSADEHAKDDASSRCSGCGVCSGGTRIVHESMTRWGDRRVLRRGRASW
jgi:hypothetical protein